MEKPANRPYSTALKLIRKRLKWDLSPLSLQSRRRLREYQDSRPGAKAVIVCNGPSLLKTDLRVLDGIDSFGLNRINVLFETNAFRPSYIACVDHLALENNQAFFNSTSIPLFLAYDCAGFIKPRKNVTYLHICTTLMFARDCSHSIHTGFSVTSTALQLAFHMGYRDVALIGCDHNYARQGTANSKVVSDGAEKSHFDPNYFPKGQSLFLPDLAATEFFFHKARVAYESVGGRVVNCTVGGKLDIFPRMEIEEWKKAFINNP